jgi:hypothetical protein
LNELLTESSPENGSTVDEALVPDSAVGTDSGTSEGKTVSAERFNGLMSKFNKTHEELDTERQYRMDLEARLHELEAKANENQPKDNKMTDVTNLENQVQVLTQMLAQQQIEGVKRSVLEEFPDVAPFVDLIEAGDAESFRSLAKTLNERVQVLKISSGALDGTPDNSIIEATPEVAAVESNNAIDAPVFGGGSGAMAPSPDAQDRIAEAIRNKDFGAFMRAKTEATASELTL